MSRGDAILDIWFEGIDDTTSIDKKRNPFRKWFAKDDAFDNELRQRFEKDFEGVLANRIFEQEDSPRGILALIVLCDQFGRNMYRGTKRMYEGDRVASSLTLGLIEEGKDRRLNLIERIFVYMPLMHAEDRKNQELSVRQFGQLVVESDRKCPSNTFYYSYTLDYAKKHSATIERFGRFPHRNMVLGRESSPDENDYLKRKGSGF